ncbi:hypothetical protein ACSZNU_17920 [Aeromonas hydrophila]
MTDLSPREVSRLLRENPKKKYLKNRQVIEQARRSLQVKTLCERVLAQFIGFPEPTTEFVFHPHRKWRLDFAWPAEMIAVEVHGGIYSGGRHTRGRGFIEDRTKMNSAQLLGWVVLEVAPEHIKSGQLRAWLLQAFGHSKRGES